MDVSGGMVKELYNISNITFISRSALWYNDTVPTNAYIIRCRDEDDLEEKIGTIRRDYYWNPKAQFMIYMEIFHNLTILTNIFRNNNMYNVIVFTNYLNALTIFGFDSKRDACHIPRTMKLLSLCSEFNGTSWIYPVFNVSKFHGCHFKLVSHTFWPFTNFKSGSLGIEQQLLKSFEEHSGITFELVQYEGDGAFGNILTNFTHTGMLHKIETYEVDGAIGGYYMKLDRNRGLDYADALLVDHLRMLIARARLLRTWEAVYKQLGFFTVMLIILFFIKFTIAAVLLSLFRNNRKNIKDVTRDILVVFGYFLNNVNIKHKTVSARLSHRLMVLFMLLFVFWISCAIQASLLSATSNPIRENQLTDIGEVFHTHTPILVKGLRKEIADYTDTEALSCDSIPLCMLEVKKGHSLYTVVTDTTFDSLIWQIDDDDRYQLYKLKESLETIFGTVYFRRGSFILKSFNKFIRTMKSNGIMKHFYQRLKYKEKKVYNSHVRKGQRQRDFNEYRSAFLLLGGGLSLSIVVFWCELFYKYYY